MLNKKGISPVIATALFLIISVISVVSFQVWFTSYSSSLFADADIKSQDSTSNSGFEDIIGNNMYFKNSGNNNLTINSIKIGGVDCDISKELSYGMSEIPVYSCLLGQDSGKKDIVIITDDKIFSEVIYYDDPIIASLWNKTYDFGGDGFDYGSDLISLDDGGYMLFGRTPNGANDYDFWLIRVDYNGEVIWNKTYNGPGNGADIGVSMIETSNQNYILFGDTGNDFWLVKVDSNGNVIWNYTYDSPGSKDETAGSVVETNDGGFVMVGSSREAPNNNAVWLVKVDSDGVEVWNRTFDGGTDFDYGYDVIELNSGSFFISGKLFSNAWLIKTNSTGHELWNTTYGISRGDRIIKLRDGNFGFFGDYYNGANTDYFFIKIDSDGNQIFNRSYNSPGDVRDDFQDAIELNDRGFALIGYSENSPDDFWLIRTNRTGHSQWNKTYDSSGANDDTGKAIIELNDGGFALYGEIDNGEDSWLIRTDSQGNTN